MTQKDIDVLVRCFRYMVRKNEEDRYTITQRQKAIKMLAAEIRIAAEKYGLKVRRLW